CRGLEQSAKPVRRDRDVVVDQRHEFRARIECAAHRLVVRTRVAGVLRQPEVLDFRELPREQRPRSVAGGVVHHHQVHAGARILSAQRREAFGQEVRAVPGEHHGVHLRALRCYTLGSLARGGNQRRSSRRRAHRSRALHRRPARRARRHEARRSARAPALPSRRAHPRASDRPEAAPVRVLPRRCRPRRGALARAAHRVPRDQPRRASLSRPRGVDGPRSLDRVVPADAGAGAGPALREEAAIGAPRRARDRPHRGHRPGSRRASRRPARTRPRHPPRRRCAIQPGASAAGRVRALRGRRRSAKGAGDASLGAAGGSGAEDRRSRAWLRQRRRAARPVSRRGGFRPALTVRGLRPSPAGGDGLWSAVHRQRRSRAGRGFRWRGPPFSPGRPGRVAAPARAGAPRSAAAGRSVAQGHRARARLPLGTVRGATCRGLSGGGAVRVALVHDWLTGLRGGERVLEQLCLLYPAADIFTLVYMPGTCGEIIERHRIRTSFLDRLPKRAYRHYLPLFPLAIESLDLDGYDLVVSTSHAVAKGCRPAKGAVHVAYIHTPMRYVWDQFEWYFGAGRAAPLTRLAAGALAPMLRSWDVRSTARAHALVANSRFVAGRIRRYWSGEAWSARRGARCASSAPFRRRTCRGSTRAPGSSSCRGKKISVSPRWNRRRPDGPCSPLPAAAPWRPWWAERPVSSSRSPRS